MAVTSRQLPTWGRRVLYYTADLLASPYTILPHLKLAPFWRKFVSSFPRKTSLLHWLFPITHQRARLRLEDLRYQTLPALRHRTQLNLYRYIRRRQAQKSVSLLSRLRRRLRRPSNNVSAAHAKMTSESEAESFRGDGQPGTRRRKLAGYFKAANELRQTYQQNVHSWANKDGSSDMPGEFDSASFAQTGDEEMLLFPSYARRHVKQKVGFKHGFGDFRTLTC